MKIKVIIDSNIFLSGIIFGGLPAKILDLWNKGKITSCISPKLQAEITEKLTNKFKVDNSFLEKITANLNQRSTKYLPSKRLNILKDKDDNFLLELADESHADYLITGDKELLRLKKYKSTKIISAKVFLKVINQKIP